MIECNPAVNFGMPALKGRRLTVYDIVTKIYLEESLDAALEDYSISTQDAHDAVDYCMRTRCQEDSTLVEYCDGCILRTVASGMVFKRQNYKELEIEQQKYVISKDGKQVFIGSLKEFEDSEFGKVTWLIAEEVSRYFGKVG